MTFLYRFYDTLKKCIPDDEDNTCKRCPVSVMLAAVLESVSTNGPEQCKVSKAFQSLTTVMHHQNIRQMFGPQPCSDVEDYSRRGDFGGNYRTAYSREDSECVETRGFVDVVLKTLSRYDDDDYYDYGTSGGRSKSNGKKSMKYGSKSINKPTPKSQQSYFEYDKIYKPIPNLGRIDQCEIPIKPNKYDIMCRIIDGDLDMVKNEDFDQVKEYMMENYESYTNEYRSKSDKSTSKESRELNHLLGFDKHQLKRLKKMQAARAQLHTQCM